MDAKKTGEFIAQLRNEMGLTQKALAELLNVSDKTISRWECGRGYPDIILLKSIATQFNISINELLNGERIEVKDQSDKNDEIIIDILTSHKEINRLLISKAILGVSIILYITAFCMFSGDSSLVSICSILATIILIVRVFIFTENKARAGIIAGLIIVSAFSFFECYDYINIRNGRPPNYNISILYTTDSQGFDSDGGIIIYDKIFYDVVRTNIDTKQECYTIYDNSLTDNYIQTHDKH